MKCRSRTLRNCMLKGYVKHYRFDTLSYQKCREAGRLISVIDVTITFIEETVSRFKAKSQDHETQIIATYINYETKVVLN